MHLLEIIYLEVGLVEKIGLITDSGSDVPADMIDRYHIYVAPLTINYTDSSYRDGIDIQPEEIYRRFGQEIPKTSMPSMKEMHRCFERAIEDGCTQALVVTISSGLSGTLDAMRIAASSFPQLAVEFVDSKSIGFVAGFAVIYAAELLDEGLTLRQVAQKCRQTVEKTHVFFIVDSLEYLYAGGRIGKTTYRLGTILNLRPIITCDKEKGVYITVAKVRGRKASIRKAVELAQKAVGKSRRYRVGIAHGDALEEAKQITACIPEDFPYAIGRVEPSHISPALVVHTGPGLLGIGVQVLD